jgi:hypothetical protein
MSTGRPIHPLTVPLLTFVCFCVPSPARADDKPSLSALIDALDEPDFDKFRLARDNLAKAVTKKDLPALMKAARKRSPRVRAGILYCLYKFKGYPDVEPPDVRSYLVEFLEDKDVDVRCAAAGAAVDFAADSPELIAALVKALDDDERPKRRYATSVAECAMISLGYSRLGEAARPAHAKLIRIAERHDNRLTREGAIVALGQLAEKDKARREKLAAVLLRLARPGNEEWVRVKAIGMLGFRDDADWPFVKEFRKLWRDERQSKGGGSHEILLTILYTYEFVGVGAKDALPDVLPLLEGSTGDDLSPSSARRTRALMFISRLGKQHGKEALPAVRKLAEDKKAGLHERDVARKTLAKLEDQR